MMHAIHKYKNLIAIRWLQKFENQDQAKKQKKLTNSTIWPTIPGKDLCYR